MNTRFFIHIIISLVVSSLFIALSTNINSLSEINLAYSNFDLSKLNAAYFISFAIANFVVFSLLYLYQKKGIARFYSLVLTCLVVLIYASLILGLYLFTEYFGFERIALLDSYLIMQTSYKFKFIFFELMMVIPLISMMLMYLLKDTKMNNPLGNAHFANPFEFNKAGFFDDRGIIVGKKLGQFLRSGGYEHVLVFSPAGSGKTTSIAMPNLLSWQQSCVVNDTKYELFEQTSRYRADNFDNEVYLWAPTRPDGKTHRYNPLKFISKDPLKRIGEIQMMGHVLVPNGQGEPIWYQASRGLFLSLILYLLDTPGSKITFGELYNLANQ